MALFENFPYTNLHELNLDWLIDNIKLLQESQVVSVNGETGEVILYKNENMQLPDVDSNVWQIIRTTDGITAGIHFNSTTGIATIVNGNTLDAIYTHDNPPPYPVTSVNGETGDITLYDEQYVRLPDLDDAQMTNWTLFRHLNTVSRGIQFDDDGSVYIIDGVNRYKVYSTNDTPPYPVTSVNGATGAVVLYQDQYVQLPPLTGAGMTEWTLFRLLNSTVCGFKLADDGSVSVLNGSDEYPVYIQGINDPSPFNDPTDALLELSEEVAAADGKAWGIVRPIEDDSYREVGIYFKYNNVTQDYDTYMRVGLTETKLLTAADIPSSAGVVSFNGQTGAITVDGSDLVVSSSDVRTIAQAISDAADADEDISGSVAYVENTNTASQNIPDKSYVIWKGSAYVSTQAISVGSTLSGTNLSALAAGGITNDLKDMVEGQVSLGSNNTFTGIPTVSGTWKTLASFNPPSNGIYIIDTNVSFAAGTGNRILIVDTSETDTNTATNSVAAEGRACLQKVKLYSLLTTDTVYIRGYQNSGSNMNLTGSYRLLKVSD